jgi:outer membrane receptor for ferrienterochelin and colicins
LVIGRLDGQIDLNQINLNDVERIEIVEGPLSVNYGSNALAGTINIITKKESSEKWSAGLSQYTENIGTYNFHSTFSKQFGKRHLFRLSAGRNYFDGWRPEDPFWPSFKAQLADSSRVDQWNPKEQFFGRLQYFYRLQDLRLGYKAEFLDETITNKGLPRLGANSISAFDDYYHTNRQDHSVSAEGRLTDKWNLNLLAAFNDFERIKESRRIDLTTLESRRRPETAGNDVQDTSAFSLWMSRASFSSNYDSSWINYEIGYDFNFEQASGERIDGDNQYLGDYALFSSLQISKGNLLLKPAIRYAYNTNYQAPITPALNLKYQLPNQVTIRLAYARGFRAPSLKELYFNFDDVNHSLFGNPDLKAEESDNYSASISRKHLFENFMLEGEFATFYNDIQNQINFANVYQFGGGETLVYLNIGEFHTKGLDFRSFLVS